MNQPVCWVTCVVVDQNMLCLRPIPRFLCARAGCWAAFAGSPCVAAPGSRGASCRQPVFSLAGDVSMSSSKQAKSVILYLATHSKAQGTTALRTV